MSYYYLHSEERLAYQKEYNKSEYYKAYQQNYFQLNKERLVKERKLRCERIKKTEIQVKKQKPLAQYKIDILERMLRRKLKDYNKTLYQEDVSRELTTDVIFNSPIKDVDVKPFEGFTIRNNKFVLSFN